MKVSVCKNYNEAKVLGAFSGWSSIQEVLYEVPTVAQTRSRQKLFQGPQ